MLGGENAFRDGYVIAGYEYFTRDGVEPHPDLSVQVARERGLAYQYRELSPEAKEDKYKEIAAMPQEEQVKHLNAPKAFLSFVACIKGEPKLQVVTIPSGKSGLNSRSTSTCQRTSLGETTVWRTSSSPSPRKAAARTRLM